MNSRRLFAGLTVALSLLLVAATGTAAAGPADGEEVSTTTSHDNPDPACNGEINDAVVCIDRCTTGYKLVYLGGAAESECFVI